MKLTYKIKHNRDFTHELGLARKVAEFAIANRDKLSSKHVSHIGLKSAISNNILYKYGRNKRIKVIHKVKLTIPGQAIVNNKIQPLDLKFELHKPYTKICQAEVDNQYIYLTVEVLEGKPIKNKKHIGVDLNTTGHCAVVAVKETGKVYKLGKKAEHTHKKYKDIRKNLQSKGKFIALAKIKKRESRIVTDLNHKISRFIINLAVQEKGGVKLENLKGIRGSRSPKSFKYALNSWSYFQLNKFIEYKALLAGVPITYIQPAYTSKSCSRCGVIGLRNDKLFKCPNGHVEHADTNAAFNISVWSTKHAQLFTERDVNKGDTATPQEV